MRFAKGHGTENDFVILVDPDGEQGLPPGLAARLCDRRAGIGADGVLRAVRTEAPMPARRSQSRAARLGESPWSPAGSTRMTKSFSVPCPFANRIARC